MKCPLEKTDPGHYQYIETNSVNSILAMIRNRNPPGQPINRINNPLVYTDENGFARLDFPEKTYFRLFKRRYNEKKRKRFYGPMYAVMSADKQPIAIVTTKKEALHILSQNRAKHKIFKRPHKDNNGERFGELGPGSFILKLPRDYKYDVSHRDHLNDVKHMVATKRCDECPNKTSTRGACHCGFWSVIRDSTDGRQWWSMHDIKRYQKKAEKTKVINIRLTDEDLFN
jgi:hypothetical protein